MVSVVQLVERQIVVLVVVGSSPTVHPKRKTTPKGRFSFCNVQRGFQLICIFCALEAQSKRSSLWAELRRLL